MQNALREGLARRISLKRILFAAKSVVAIGGGNSSRSAIVPQATETQHESCHISYRQFASNGKHLHACHSIHTTHTTTFGQHRLGRESSLLPATRLVRSFDSTDSMFIRIGYEIALRFPVPTTVIHLLHVHPSRQTDLVEPERPSTAPALRVEEHCDGFANHRTRICAPAGTVRLFSEAIIRDSGELDPYQREVGQVAVSEIPDVLLGPDRWEVIASAWLLAATPK